MVGDESSSSTKDAGIRHDVSAMKIEIDKHKLTLVNSEKMPESVRTDTPNREETENKKLSKKKRAIECEDIRKDTILKIAEEVPHRKNGVTTDAIALSKEMKNILEEGSRALVAGNARLSVSNFQTVFDRLSKLPTDTMECNEYIWLKYSYFISLIEANNDADLLIALKLLPDLKKTLFASIPVYHYAVAKILIKLNRFRLAEAEIEKCRNSMKEHTFGNQCWPGTKEVIKETNCDGLEEYLQEMTAACTCYHIPDAICKFGGCLSASTHPFPSREIFHSDADFKGYIVLTCQEGCKIQYHPLCWKNVKDNFSNLDKLPDKDCLGKPCVTPDCKNAFNEPSVIHKIEIIGSDGNIKSQCMQDPAAENKQKEIAIRKRQRLKSDEHKTDKLPTKTKTRVKKINAPDRSQSSENIVISMKPPAQKENKPIQTGGVPSVKSNIPEKNKEPKLVEMNSTAAQKDFICTYFLMLLNTMGPLSKEKVEEEWEKFYPNCKPVSGLVSKSSGIFNLLKNSPYFVMLDNLLCIKESVESTPKEENEVSVNSNVTNTAIEESQPNLAKENAQLDSEIREIEKELSSNDVHVNSMNYNPIIPNMVPRSQLENIRKEIPMMEEEKPKNMMIPNSLKNYSLGRPTFGFFEDIKSDDKRYTVPIRESNKMNEYAYNKSMETNKVQEPMPITYEEYLPLPPPIQWRDEGIESSLGFSFGDFDSAFKNMAIRPPRMKDVQSTYETRNRNREMSTQTEETGENKHSNDDESWMQHMQMAVNELIKKNKDLMKIRDDMMRNHENEVEALRNQIQTLRNSYEDYIKSLKESVNRNVDDDRRKMIALEQRMKIHEQILQSTKEELRKKDFDLLEAKRNLGTAMLERVERESNRQVQRLVTALASLPCNNQDADAVGRAMAKWEETGNRALKAKIDFWTACTTHQTKLYNGFGSDSLQELVIPVIEEPAGPCPLDNLTITLLQDKENSEANLPRPPTNAPELPPFRNGTQYQPLPPIVPVQLLPPSVPIPVMSSPISAPLSPTSLGARPREPLGGTNGESGLRSWPSIPSIQNSTHSSSTGTARALSNFGKLMIELRRCYPSRSEDELCSAVKAVRRKNKYSLSGLTIERIVIMVGTALEWWPEPTEGSMGLDKFMGWASDVVAPKDETFSSVSKVSKSTEWIMNSSNSLLEGEKEDCCICLQGMSEPKTELICLHSFHTQCIRQWLSKESVCPICRKFTRMPDEFPTLK